MENAQAESFSCRVGDECLNLPCFESPSQARELLERWRDDHDDPHTGARRRNAE